MPSSLGTWLYMFIMPNVVLERNKCVLEMLYVVSRAFVACSLKLTI